MITLERDAKITAKGKMPAQRQGRRYMCRSTQYCHTHTVQTSIVMGSRLGDAKRFRDANRRFSCKINCKASLRFFRASASVRP